MKIHESAEDYLEAISKLRENHGMVRSIDIVRELGFSKPSISAAMRNLRENGYIQMDGDGYITPLPPGEEIAQRIYGRHKLLTQIFVQLGVSPETAAADACKVEHDLSDETFFHLRDAFLFTMFHLVGGIWVPPNLLVGYNPLTAANMGLRVFDP
ncbi:MAG: metal-dependent transcriptional regulator [Clostridiales bacterium]|nr:metal-dependent transcriptional regulator [Clostridiales bacterium]